MCCSSEWAFRCRKNSLPASIRNFLAQHGSASAHLLILHPETYRAPRICSGNCGSSGCSDCCANRNGCGSEISAASSFCAGFCDINGNIHSLLFPALKGTGRAGREFRHVPKKEGNTRHLPTIKDVLFLFYKREKRVR